LHGYSGKAWATRKGESDDGGDEDCDDNLKFKKKLNVD
jgi:hypothetical protein